MTEITFTDAAIDDLRRIGRDAVPKVLKKVLLLLGSPTAGYQLGGDLTGFRKLKYSSSQTSSNASANSAATPSRPLRRFASRCPTGSHDG